MLPYIATLTNILTDIQIDMYYAMQYFNKKSAAIT